MNPTVYLIRYGEIGLKSKYVRNSFENTLIQNIHYAFKQEQLQCTVTKQRGRLFLTNTSSAKTTAILQKIFGIISFSPATKTTADMTDMSKTAVQMCSGHLDDTKSFALRITRTGSHTFTSQQSAVKLGNDIVAATNAKVDLAHPDFELHIEIRNEYAYFFTETIRGPGGLPYGTQGNGLVLVTSLRSLLAAWYLMKRGCKLIFANMLPAKSAMIETFLKKWYIPTNIVTIKNKEKGTFDVLSTLVEKEKCMVVISDTALYSNKENQLANLQTMKHRLHRPVLVPLIAMDTVTIQKECTRIGLES